MSALRPNFSHPSSFAGRPKADIALLKLEWRQLGTLPTVRY